MNTLTLALVLPLLGSPQDPAPAAAATNALAVDLYHRLATAAGGNLFLSPWSVSQALAMLTEGAEAETGAELRQVLHLGEAPLDPLHASFAALQQRLTQGGGQVPPATRDRIAALRTELQQRNAAIAAAEGGDWRRLREVEAAAAATATELNRLLAAADCYDLRAANSVWCDRTARLRPEFLQVLGRNYGVGAAHEVDFRGGFEGVRQQINGWVAERTEQRILDLIPAGGVDAATRLVLANAVYFRGAWRQPFPAKQTEDALFVTAEGGKVRVPLMRDRRREDVPYAAFTGAGDPFPTPLTVPADGSLVAPVYPEADGFQVVELPYQGGDLAMVLLLPRAPEGLGRLERLLTADRLTQWLAGLVRRDVDTAMPRFQQRSRLDLGASLRALGVTRAFVDPTTGAGAQFGRIQGPVGPTQQLFVGAVFHQAFVEVNEQGTEAAAATAVTMAPSAAVPKRVELVPFRPVFRADHPFLFLIRDTKSGAILFVGRVVDPAGDSH